MNRSTFYASYHDVFDLAEKTCEELYREVEHLFRNEHELGFNSNDYLKLLRHMYENQRLHLLCFKLGIDRRPIVRWDTKLAQEHFNNRHIEYHAEFFRAGFNAIARRWLEHGCLESPEEMFEVIREEYQGRE